MIAEGQVDELVAGKSSVQEVDVAASDMAALGAAIDRIEGVELLGDGVEGRLRLGLQGRTVPQLNRALLEASVDVEALVPVQKSLEDLFLALTRKEIT